MKTINSLQDRIMPKVWLMALITLFGFAACNQEDASISPEETEDFTDFALTVAESEEVYEEIEEISVGVMEELTENRPDERLSAPPSHLWRCAEVSRDTINKIITVDFGDGCEGPHGRIRSGKVIISYSGRLYQPGAFRTITLENYMVDSVQIEGTRTITNTMTSKDDFVSMSYQLEGGKITWPDGSTASREVNRSRTWIRGANPMLDEFQVEGSVSGTNRSGESYSMEILQTLVYKRSCRRIGVFIAVEGTKEVQRPGKDQISVNYGDGECDNVITISNGEDSKEINVAQEIRKRRNEMRKKK